MERQAWARVSALVWMVACAACGGSRAELAKPTAVEVTSKAELESMLAKAAPKVNLPEVVRVERHAFEGALPQAIGQAPIEAGDAVGDVLLAAVSGKTSVTPGFAMRCVAGQLAHFVGRHDKPPEPELLEALSRRCGVSRAAEPSWRSVLVSAEQREGFVGDLTGQLGTLLAKDWSKVLAYQDERHVREVGLAVMPDERGGLVVTLAWQDLMATLEPMAMHVPKGEAFVVRGRAIDKRFETMYAMVTVGVHDTAPCVDTGRVKAPQFEFQCPIHAGDAHVQVSVSGRYPKSIVRDIVLGQRVYHARRPSASWAPVAEEMPAWIGEEGWAARFRDEVVGHVNAERAKIGLKPLKLHLKQSQVVQRAVPILAALRYSGDLESFIINRNALYGGLSAGWEIKAPHLPGRSFVDASARAVPKRFSRELLERAHSRPAIMARGASEVAIGLERFGDRLVLFFAVWETVSYSSHARMANKVLRQINAARAVLKLPKLTWFADLDSSADAHARKVWEGKLETQVAAGEFVDDAVEGFGTGVGYMVMHFDSLHDMSAPPLKGIRGKVALQVIPYRSQDSPFVRYIVIAVYSKYSRA